MADYQYQPEAISIEVDVAENTAAKIACQHGISCVGMLNHANTLYRATTARLGFCRLNIPVKILKIRSEFEPYFADFLCGVWQSRTNENDQISQFD